MQTSISVTIAYKCLQRVTDHGDSLAASSRLSGKMTWVRVTWFLVHYQSFSLDLCIQDYKCLHAAVMICSTLINTHTQTDGQLLTSYTVGLASKLN